MWLWLWLWLCVNPRATKFGDLIFPLQPHASCTSLTRLFPLTRLLHASYSSACRETKLANPTLPLYLMILSDNNIVLHSTKLDGYHFFLPLARACPWQTPQPREFRTSRQMSVIFQQCSAGIRGTSLVGNLGMPCSFPRAVSFPIHRRFLPFTPSRGVHHIQHMIVPLSGVPSRT